MVAYYACLYCAALRPEEGVGIEVPRNLRLPDSDDEWGEFILEAAEPHARTRRLGERRPRVRRWTVVDEAAGAVWLDSDSLGTTLRSG